MGQLLVLGLLSCWASGVGSFCWSPVWDSEEGVEYECEEACRRVGAGGGSLQRVEEEGVEAWRRRSGQKSTHGQIYLLLLPGP